MRNFAKTIPSLLSVALISVALVACSQGTKDDLRGFVNGFHGEPGPYLEEYRDLYESAKSDLGKAIFADGKLTEHEIQEVETKYKKCLSEYGYTTKNTSLNSFEISPEPGVTPSIGANEAGDKCDDRVDYEVVLLQANLEKTNPKNEDLTEKTLECFKSKGLISTEYSKENYEKDYVNRTVPFINSEPESKEVIQCQEDPLGLLK